MKKETKASKIMKYIASHPKAKARDVAKALKVSINSVYQATYLAKKKVGKRAVSVLTPNARMSKALFSDPSEHGTQDSVNSPLHYKVGGIEAIDYIEAKALNYNLGNVVKYVSRSDYKGNKVEDLKKARWYLCREISNLSK